MPVELSLAVPAGTAILLVGRPPPAAGQGRTHLVPRCPTPTNLSKNLIRLRAEGRWAFAVTKPDSVVIVDLTA